MVSMASNAAENPAVACKQSPALSQTNDRRAFQTKTRSPIQKKAKRHRKQTITSRLSDSGIEEDLSAQSPVGTVVVSGKGKTSAGQLGLLTWHQHYGDAGFQIQKDNETQFHLPKCLARQPQVTPEARCTLVSWLIPVHKYFHLSFECCCLAVNIMDRFLASTAVAADCFQLLGVTALLLASKQVEVSSPRISQLLGLCCGAFTKEQLCNLECLILLRLHFRLAAPTLAFFLEYHINCGEAAQPPPPPPAGQGRRDATPRVNDLARRICELSLADYAFSRYLPSLTAACALRLSAELLADGGEPDGAGAAASGTPGPARPEEGGPRGTSRRTRQLPGSGRTSADADPGRSGRGRSPDTECRENLKLLVELNRDTLGATWATW